MTRILGLDIGTNSIGGTLIELGNRKNDGSYESGKILWAHSHIFTPSVEDDYKAEPKNRKRRVSRGARRQHSRRRMRRDTLTRILISEGLLPELPADGEERVRWFNSICPYQARAEGLNGKVSLHVLGRALFHICKRRGFKSNSKADRGEKNEKEKSIVYKTISALQKKIEQTNSRTLGKCMYKEYYKDGEKDNKAIIRGKAGVGGYTHRNMYKHEFELLWEEQKKHYPDILTNELKKKIEDAIFYQRPLKSQKGVVGFCDLERKQRVMRKTKDKDKKGRDIWIDHGKYDPNKPVPEGCQIVEKGPRRIAMSHPVAQKFRALQDINNIRVYGEELSADQRKILLDALEGEVEITTPQSAARLRGKKTQGNIVGLPKNSLSWTEIKSALNLPMNTKLKFEDSKEDGIPGLKTWHAIANVLGKEKWDDLEKTNWDKPGPKSREQLYLDLTTIESEEIEDGASRQNENPLLKRLTGHWEFPEETAKKLAKLKFEKGYASLSLRAINRLLTYMEKGETFPDAKEAIWKEEGDKRYSQSPMVSGLSSLPAPPLIRNPVVQKALYEVRDIVNRIIRKFGKPDIIRVELARDAKLPRKKKATIHEEQKARKKEKENFEKEILADYPHAPTYTENGKKRVMPWAIEMYRMYKEQGCRCPYTGDCIGDSLFSNDVEVDHIIPWSKSGDDSYMNKVVCKTTANREKGDRTPWEAWQETQRWADMDIRLRNMPKVTRYFVNKNPNATKAWYTKEVDNPKWERVLSKEEPDGQFATRQLKDTQYIATEVTKYLESLGVKVRTNKGIFTAKLRRHWGLEGDRERKIAGVIPNGRNYDVEKGKDRSDHRHHAVDAIVIALTDVALVQKMSSANAKTGHVDIALKHFPKPWPTFYEDVKAAIDKIIVSHRATRKIRGALHKEFSYGPTSKPKEFVRRIPLDKLEKSRIKDIRDEWIKKVIINRLAQCADSMKEALEDGIFVGKNPVKNIRINHSIGEPIQIPGENRFVESDGNHHLEIVRNKKTNKWKEGDIVTTWEVNRREKPNKKKGEVKRPVVNREYGEDYEFMMSLSKNDIVRMNDDDGNSRFYVVQKLSKKDFGFREHCSADKEDETKPAWLRIRSMKDFQDRKPVKVHISPIGDICELKND